MNVISLFNGAIPLIALQVSAYEDGKDVSLVFTKIMDRTDLGTDEEEELVTTDRNYWVNEKSTKNVIKIVDSMYEDLGDLISDYELKYNKFYIGLAINGVAKNFMSFKPMKKFLNLRFRGSESPELSSALEDSGLKFAYQIRDKRYQVKINKFEEYQENRDLFIRLVNYAKESFL